MDAIDAFTESHNRAVDRYNSAVSHGAYGLYTAFQKEQANIAATAMLFLQSRLTQYGFATIQSDLQDSKNSMTVADTATTPLATSMSCCYSTVQSKTSTLVSTSPLRATVTISTTISGSSVGGGAGIYHKATVNLSVDNQVGSASSGYVSPSTYINITASVVLDTSTNLCLTDGAFCFENSTAQVYCTAANAYIAQFPFTAQVEVAFTQAYWKQGMAYTCSKGSCTYTALNQCTTATTPPDDPIGSVFTGDYTKIATYITWRTFAPCIRFNWPGPWSCGPPLVFMSTLNATLPPYACTHNP